MVIIINGYLSSIFSISLRGLFIVLHGTTRYYKDLDTIDFDEYLDYMGNPVSLFFFFLYLQACVNSNKVIKM
jgi:hypothetical protein